MTKTNSVVAIYGNSHPSGGSSQGTPKVWCDMKKLSIVGKDYHTDENVVGYYNAGDRMKYWGKQGAFWVVSGECCLEPASLPYCRPWTDMVPALWSHGLLWIGRCRCVGG